VSEPSAIEVLLLPLLSMGLVLLLPYRSVPTSPFFCTLRSLLLAGGSEPKKPDPSGVPHHAEGIVLSLEKPGKERSRLEKRKISAVISHFEFFQLMKDDEKALEDLCGKISMQRFAENEYIFHQGDTGDVFYILFSGGVSITYVANGRSEAGEANRAKRSGRRRSEVGEAKRAKRSEAK
jgi:hypothetical protein